MTLNEHKDGGQPRQQKAPQNAPAAAPARLRIKDLAAYGAMAFPLAFAGLPIYVFAPDFYANTLGVSLTVLGIALLILRAVDAVQDPLIGSLSDRFHRFRSFIVLGGATLLAAGFWMVFHPLAAMPVAWFCLAVFLCTTGFSIVSINLQALGGIWHTDEHGRTRITAWREAAGLVGLLAASAGPTLLGAATDAPAAFHSLSLLYVPILAAACWAFCIWLRGAPLRPLPLKRQPLRLKDQWHDPWRRRFFAIFALNTVASAIPAVLVLFFIRDRLGSEHLAGLFLLIYFLSGVLAMPVWQAVSKRTGKVRAWALSMALSIVTFFWAVFLQSGQVEAYGVVCALSGLALGADLALPPSILADHIAGRNKQGEAGRLFAFMTLLSKSALALATGIALPVLGLAGYQPGASMTPALQLTLSLAYAGVPCLLKLATLAWLLRSFGAIASPYPVKA